MGRPVRGEVTAEITGPAAGDLAVAITPSVVLDATASTVQHRLTFTTAGAPIHLEEVIFFSDVLAADEGERRLGLTDRCGRRWDEAGARMADPCAGASPVVTVEAGRPFMAPLALHRRVERGAIAGGRYVLELPFRTGLGLEGAEGILRLVYEVRSLAP